MQTSAKDLTKKQRQVIVDQFVNLLADLRSPSEAKAFFESFLTETEQSVFAKRLAIMWLLEKGESYDEIKKQLHVSSATISSVAALMKQQGSQLSMKKIKVDQWADHMAKKISGWLPF